MRRKNDKILTMFKNHTLGHYYYWHKHDRKKSIKYLKKALKSAIKLKGKTFVYMSSMSLFAMDAVVNNFVDCYKGMRYHHAQMLSKSDRLDKNETELHRACDVNVMMMELQWKHLKHLMIGLVQDQ